MNDTRLEELLDDMRDLEKTDLPLEQKMVVSYILAEYALIPKCYD